MTDIVRAIKIRWPENATSQDIKVLDVIKLVWKREGEIRRIRRKWEDNIKMDNKYEGYDSADWFRTFQDDTAESSSEHGNVSLHCSKCREFGHYLNPISFSEMVRLQAELFP
jgi:hypothetical protein